MLKYVFFLKGLDCAGCAAGIEQELKGIDGLSGVSVDFFDKELTIYVKDWKISETVADYVRKVVKKIEPDIEVLLSNQKVKNIRFRDTIFSSLKSTETITLIIGVSLVILGFFIKQELPKNLLYLTGYILIGKDIVLGALRKLFSRNLFNEQLLMTIATIGALFIGEYLEAIAVMLFYQVGRYLESKMVDYSQKSVSELLSISPEYANLEKDGQIIKVNPEKINIGDIIVIKPGERVPLDCTVVSGTTEIDNSLITGESVPQLISIGDKLLSGAINLHSVLKAEVDKDFETSTISRIIDLIKTAKMKKTNTERFITRFARIYTPVIMGLALLITVIPVLFIEGAAFSTWFYRSLIFLVIACPCALVISVPLSFFSGLAVLIKGGVLIKGAVYIETLALTDKVFFDKTGTLTTGKMEVSSVTPATGVEESTVLEYAYYAEHHSNHPLAVAVNMKYHQTMSNHQADTLPDIISVKETPGRGVIAILNEGKIIVGSISFLNDSGITVEYNQTKDQALVAVALNDRYLGVIEFSDTIRQSVTKMISQLKEKNIPVTMLTGDKEAAALRIAKDVGIDDYYAELKPEDKLKVLEKYQKERSVSTNMRHRDGKTVFIGDGINDAPAMAAADVGLAMGGIGAAVSIEAADVVLQTDEIDKLAHIITISRKTLNKAKQNIVFALGIKLIFLLLGALGLITIWGAVFADVGVTLLAVLNSLQLLKYRKLMNV